MEEKITKNIKINKSLLRHFKKMFNNDFILYYNNNHLYFISIVDNFIKINNVSLNLENNVFYKIENQYEFMYIYNDIAKTQKIKINLLNNNKIIINDYEINCNKLDSNIFVYKEILKIKNKNIINDIVENIKIYKKRFKKITNHCFIYNIDKKKLIFNNINTQLSSFYQYNLKTNENIEIKQDFLFYIDGLSCQNKLFKSNLSYNFKEIKIFKLNEEVYCLEFDSKNYGFGFFIFKCIEDLEYNLNNYNELKKIKNKNIILEKLKK